MKVLSQECVVLIPVLADAVRGRYTEVDVTLFSGRQLLQEIDPRALAKLGTLSNVSQANTFLESAAAVLP